MGKRYEYDAFISHAVEDKIGIANDLCRGLEQAGLKIWYSGFELHPGDSIDKRIPEGLNASRFGIIILSKNYLAKIYTLRELFHLMSKEEPDRKVLLPILYDVTPEEVAAKHLPLADRFALRAEKGIDYLVERLVAEINRGKQGDAQKVIKKRRRRWLVGFSTALVLSGGVYTGTQLYDASATTQSVEATVENLVARHQSALSALSRDGLGNIDRLQVPLEPILSVYNEFREVKSRYRNVYTLITPDSIIRSRKNIEAALGISVTELTPSNNFGMEDPILFLLSDTTMKGVRQVRYRVENSMPLIHEQEETDVNSSARKVLVTYRNNIRAIHTTLDFPGEENIKRYTVVIYGFLPERMYVLRKRGER